MSYREIARGKQEQRRQRIPKTWILAEEHLASSNLLRVPQVCGILTDRELEITGKYDAVDLVEKIANGSFSAREVTVAFCKRAAIAQQLVGATGVVFTGKLC